MLAAIYARKSTDQDAAEANREAERGNVR